MQKDRTFLCHRFVDFKSFEDRLPVLEVALLQGNESFTTHGLGSH